MVREAIGRLVLLVVDETGTAAAAGVDLGGGFTSARLAGARGDRRDAVLAALEVLGNDAAHRLGDRTAGLVALFGPSATKRVGTAAHAAVAEQRWAALRLARSVARRPSTELVCAPAIATTCAAPSTTDTVRVVAPGQTSVPGFPASDLADDNGPWQRARAAAVDLGAPAELVEDRVAEHGLLVPAALLGTGGWPALWRRAHR